MRVCMYVCARMFCGFVYARVCSCECACMSACEIVHMRVLDSFYKSGSKLRKVVNRCVRACFCVCTCECIQVRARAYACVCDYVQLDH